MLVCLVSNTNNRLGVAITHTEITQQPYVQVVEHRIHDVGAAGYYASCR